MAEVGRVLGCVVPGEAAGVQPEDLSYDSRAVSPRSLFFCVVGANRDGHDHAAEAVASGAIALVCERPIEASGAAQVPQLIVPNSRAAMSRLAAPFYGHPSRRLEVAGVTGTNGKTTTCFMLESIFRASGDPAGLVGTVESRVAGQRRPATRTTPEAVDMQRLMREMVDAGVSYCVLEATSIGIESGRIEGIRFRACAFTNLTHDHLDHHPSMEDYFGAKARLFSDFEVGTAVINADDAYGRRLLESAPVPRLSFGLAAGADVRAEEVTSDATGSDFLLVASGVRQRMRVRLPGAFNVSNALGAVGCSLCMGIDPEVAAAGIEALGSVPGRFEPVKMGQDFLVLVDYAHTPDGLASVLRAARDLTDGRVLAVFGCGGDRDRAKRPLMGRAVAGAADRAFVTSDNPRREDPRSILLDIERGMADSPPPGGYVIIEDRAEAIRTALREARSGDVVVLAGKGHETYQEVGDRVLPFDDREVAARMLGELR